MRRLHRASRFSFLSRSRCVVVALLVGVCVLPACDRRGEPATLTKAPVDPKVLASKRTGGELRLSLSGIMTLDPARSTSLSENMILHQLFQGLVRFDSHLRVVPDLAHRWSLSRDGKTYTFKLDETARFHHGRPVEAEDVVYSLRRLLNRRVGSGAYSYFSAALDGGEEAIQSPEPGVCTVQLKERDHVFINFLAQQYAKIVPRDLADQRSFRREPVGSGPFRFVHRERGEIVLEAARHGIHTRPYLDRVVFLDLDRQGELHALRDDALDFMICAPDEVDEIPGLAAFRRTRVPTLSLHFLGMNVSRPPFDDPRVRQAISVAIDRSAFEVAMQGRVKEARTILPPGMPGYDPTAKPPPHDAEKARELLRQAGYGEGLRELPEIHLLLGRIPEQVALTERLTADLTEIGVRLDLDATDDYGRFLAELESADAVVLGWGADYPDPDNFFFNLFRTGGQYNFMGYSRPEVDKLVEKARYGSGRKLERALAYREAERMVLEDQPIVPLFHDAALYCVNDDVDGLFVNAMGIYYTRLSSVWIRDRERRLATRPVLTSVEAAADETSSEEVDPSETEEATKPR